MHGAFFRFWVRGKAVRMRAAKQTSRVVIAAIVLTVVATRLAVAGDTKLPWEEYGKLVKARATVSSMGPDLFGDKADLYTDELSFSRTDVSLPGNNALPMEVMRTFAVSSRPSNQPNDLLFADWNMDLPHVSGVFATAWPDNRCSTATLPPTVSVAGGGATYGPAEYWHGDQAHMPFGGELLLADQGAQKPTDGGSYRWMTPGFTYFSCLSSIGNGSGEGFQAITPDGTKYWFNWMAQYYEPPLNKPVSGSTSLVGALTRRRDVLYATRVEDRFGNWVTYSYSNSATSPAHLTAMQSSDGRNLTFQYGPNGHVSSVSDGSHTWNYEYGTSLRGKQTLTAVVLPDGRRWTYSFGALSDAEIVYDEDPSASRSCDTTAVVQGLGDVAGAFTLSGSATAPSGATGTFDVGIVFNGRSNVPKACINWETPNNNPLNDIAVWPKRWETIGLTQKQITGPGLGTMTWTYTHGAMSSWAAGTGPTCDTMTCADPVCLSDACAGTAVTSITGSDGRWISYTFGDSYRFNEGKLLKVERGTGSDAIVSTESMTYDLAQSGQSFPTPIGTSPQQRGYGFTSEYLRPQSNRTTFQEGTTYQSNVNSFDAFARPLAITKSNSIAGSQTRTETTQYHDDLTKWVLGQLAMRTVNGTAASEIGYTTNDQPDLYKSFGLIVQTRTYNTDGTAATVKDGDQNVTTLANWMRGIPQLIDYPDGTSESAVVNNSGWITSTIDQGGYKTCYGYDAMGRLSQITYPSETQTGVCDASTWNATTQVFEPVATSEYGLAAGHWRQQIATGNRQKLIYFDALWRPVLAREYDVADVAGTQHFTAFGYDYEGRKTFASYPVSAVSTIAGVTMGVRTTYDVLGRTAKVEQDSELGTLTTTTAYLAGARKQVTDPRLNVTTTSYQVFDQPSSGPVIQVIAPEGVTQTITRDLYGNPTAITQSGTYGTESVAVTKTMIYDSYNRLCRIAEPESGSEVVDYDAASNVDWSASGQTITGTGCGREQVAAGSKVNRTYDPMNRVWTVAYPSGTDSEVYTYGPRGNVVTAQSGLSTWDYHHNHRGLLDRETLGIEGYNWALAYGFDGNASLANVTYPDGKLVNFSPDALGRPTQAGSYAVGVNYLPDGDIEHFSYLGGAEYLEESNTRNLPGNLTYATAGGTLVYSQDLSYDENANLLSATDRTLSAIRSKTLTYDGLNRLTRADAPQLWGTETYSYDPLNNIRTMAGDGITRTYHYDARNLLTSISNGSTTLHSFLYDPRGNTTQKDAMSLVFDQANRLTQVVGSASYVYDASGRRVKKTVGSGTPTYYAYSSGGQLMWQYAPLSASVGTGSDYVYLGKKLIAKLERSVSSNVPDPVASVTAPSTSSSGALAVSWSSSTYAITYTLEQQLSGGTWTKVYSGEAQSRALTESTGGSYVFRVAACNAVGCSAYTASGTTTVAPQSSSTLAVPSGTDTDGSYTVSWTAISGATSYTLQEQLNGGSWSAAYSGGAASKAIGGKTNGTWGYRVQACNAGGCSAWSATKSVTVFLPPPAPASITTPATSSGSLTVSWGGASTATSYTLQHQKNGGAWSSLYSGSATSRVVAETTTGSYTYRVAACNTSGCSAYKTSSVVTVTIPPSSAPTLSVPSGINTSGSYTVSWTAVSGATSYTLQEQINGGSWTASYTGSVASKGYSGKGNGSYGYRVQACNAGGCSGWSATQTVNVDRRPAVPAGLNITVQNMSTGLYDVAWSSAARAATYDLDESAGDAYTMTHVATYQTTGTSKAFSRANTDSYFAYKVRACNSYGCSGWSGTDTVHINSTGTSCPPTGCANNN